MILKIKKIIDDNNLLEDKRVVVAFSGGPDSVFLTTILLELDYEVEIAYFNHQLRGDESIKEEEFVVSFAQANNLKLYSDRADVKKYASDKKIGIEEAARNLRYDFFSSIDGTIATAHNLDDNVETFLFRLMRGTSLKGLRSIPIKREKFVRPLLQTKKSDILSFLQEKDIQYVQDHSNEKRDYTRNKIRLDLIPMIEKEFNPKFKDKIAALIEELGVETLEVGSTLSVSELITMPQSSRREVLANFLGSDVSRAKVELAESLLSTEGSATIDLTNDRVLKKEYNALTVEKKILREEAKEMNLNIGSSVTFGRYKISATKVEKSDIVESENKFYIDLDKIRHLTVRTRVEGDTFRPLGFGGEKKIKRFFIDLKISKFERDNIPFVLSGHEIVWVVGMRGSERFKVTPETKRVLLLEIEK